nr:unnamed protein product [Callosobruchus chinensis]
MHYMYGLAIGRSPEARRLYQERFAIRVIPERRTFANVHRSLTETGTLKPNNQLKGAHRTARTPEIEAAVLNSIDENPKLCNKSFVDSLNENYPSPLGMLIAVQCISPTLN